MTNLDKLLAVIDGEAATSPVSHLGLKWCGLSQTEIADRLGVTVKTIQRTLRGAEITRFIYAPKGQGRRTLLRRADGKTTGAFRAVVDQRIMKAEYLKHTKNKMVPAKQYGCLMELCLAWGEDERLAIFRHFMRPENWRTFMSCYKFDASCYPDKYPLHQPGRFYKHPNIYPLTDGREVAKQCYDDHLQATGKALD